MFLELTRHYDIEIHRFTYSLCYVVVILLVNQLINIVRYLFNFFVFILFNTVWLSLLPELL